MVTPRPARLRRILSSLAVVTLVALMTTSVSAAPDGKTGAANGGGDQGERRYRNRATQQAPELDPATAGAALTLILGGLAVLTDRRRRTA